MPERRVNRLTTGCNVCDIAASASSDDSSVASWYCNQPCMHALLLSAHEAVPKAQQGKYKLEQAIQCM